MSTPIIPPKLSVPPPAAPTPEKPPVLCPKDLKHGPMVLRHNHTLNIDFYGCQRYNSRSRCNATLNLDGSDPPSRKGYDRNENH